MTGEGVLKQVLKEFSSLVEDELKQWSLPEKPVDLYSPVRYMFSLGGKRMRPTLVLLGCRLFRDDVRPAIGPALAVEVFHNFTLLHDDIMDNAPLRRGKPTVHCKWSPNVAILSGDAMMVLAYEALARTEPTVLPKLLPVFNSTALEICEGQQFDMDFEQRDDVTIAEYEEMIRLKTAVLLAASLKMGALVGGASAEQAQYLYDFGLNAGIAFQLQDDILDVFGDTGKVGKQQGGDIISDKKTYLLLKAIETAQHADSEELHRWIGNSSDLPEDKVRAVTAIYDRLGIRQLAEQRMWHFHAAAQQHLDMVNGDTRWTAILREFTDSLMDREH